MFASDDLLFRSLMSRVDSSNKFNKSLTGSSTLNIEKIFLPSCGFVAQGVKYLSLIAP